jgi:hypothetical protein
MQFGQIPNWLRITLGVLGALLILDTALGVTEFAMLQAPMNASLIFWSVLKVIGGLGCHFLAFRRFAG